MESAPEVSPSAIAVVGMAGRFPGAADVRCFWDNLVAGVESVRYFSAEELRAVGVAAEMLADPAYVGARSVLDGAERFDAAFFDIGPREAEVIDPQQRLLLECAWEALESAGYDARRFGGPVGVFAGAGANTYLLANLQHNPRVMAAVGSYQAMIGGGADFLSTRISYKLGLRGPSLTVQTACSTSLVAVHLAVQSLLSGECDMALAGGVRLLVPRCGGHVYQEGGIFSRDGHCRAFDAAATGTTEGEGCGLVVLKRLGDALADGDHVHCVILGSAINNDGAMKIGYTVPSVDGQAEVIGMAQALARVDAGTIGLIEAHGTGTPLGDPIEFSALSRVFAAAAERGGRCALGSLKSNLGHLDAAAGIASLIKASLAVEHGVIPASLHFERPNPQIDLAASPFYVPTRATPWPAGAPRRAGVSSFGIGGTNAHVVLEAPPAPAAAERGRPRQLVVLSARSAAALETATRNLAGHLRHRSELDLADVAYTLQVGRAAFDHRRVVVCDDTADAAEVLATIDPKRVMARVAKLRERPVVFLFPGQGSQHPGMAAELYQSEPLFRQTVDECAELLLPWLGLDLRQVLYPPDGDADAEGAAQRLTATALAQPALFVVEYALARLWMSWGIRPRGMLGHSIGEYVAACLAGVFSLEDALRLVAERGRLMQEMPAGAMLTVALPAAEVLALLRTGDDGDEPGDGISGVAGLALAAVNGPSLCVVSGPPGAVAELAARLDARGVRVRRLHTSHAFHSPAMDPILERFAAAFSGVRLGVPAIPFVSNLTGGWIRPEEAATPGYWVRHLRQTVRFADGLAALFDSAGTAPVFLEVGPGQALTALVRQHPDRRETPAVLASLPAAGDGKAAGAALLRTLGQLWLAGVEIDWTGFQAGARRRRVPLPTYPFERERYWVEPTAGTQREPLSAASAVGAGTGEDPGDTAGDIASWFWLPLWRQVLPVKAAAPRDRLAAGRWLVLADPAGFGRRLAARLRECGGEVVTAVIGERFEERGARSGGETAGGAAGQVCDGDFSLRPGVAEDYGALLDRLAARGFLAQRIVHLWSAGPGDGAAAGRGHQELGFFSLMHLARALGERRTAEALPPLHIGVVSTGVHRVTGAEELVPERATLLGAAATLPQEYRGISCAAIDVTLPPAGSAQEGRLCDRLIAELCAAPAEPLVAYRGTERWLRGFEPLRLAEHEPGGNAVAVREGGAYVVLGGLGGVGLEMAGLLARLARVKLVVTGLRPFAERAEWPALARGGGSRAARTARRLLDLEAAGAAVWTAAADVTDAASLAGVLAEARRRFGPIRGVIHAAGLPGGGLMQWRSPAAAAAVLAPKVAGTLLLAELLAADTPDFVVLCSSLNGLTGSLGQADYAAANAFLDAFAQSRHGALPVVAIDWDRWRDVGMAAGTLAETVAGTAAGMAAGNAAAAASRGAEATDLQPFPHRLLRQRGTMDTAAAGVAAPAGAPSRAPAPTGMPAPAGTPFPAPVPASMLTHAGDGAGAGAAVVFVGQLRPAEDWVIDEHRLGGQPVVPGTAYLEMAAASLRGIEPAAGAIEIRDVQFITPLRVGDDETREFQAVLRQNGDGFHHFSVRSRDVQGWQEHVVGAVGADAAEAPRRIDVSSFAGWDEEILGDDYREELKQIGLGPRWDVLKKIYRRDGDSVGLLELAPEFAADVEDFKMHPALLDAATSFAVYDVPGARGNYYLPLSYKRLRVSGPLPSRLYSRVRRHQPALPGVETLAFDVALVDETGLERIAVEEFTVKRVDVSAALRGHAERQSASAAARAALPSAPSAASAPLPAALAGGMAPAQAVEAFRRILAAADLAQVAVSVRPLPVVLALARATTAASLAAALGPQAGGAAHARPDLETPYVAPRGELEERLAALWCEVLGLERVGAADDFFELGGHSLLGTQLMSRVRATFAVEVPLGQLFEAATVADLAAYLGTRLAAAAAAIAPGASAAPGADGQPRAAAQPEEGIRRAPDHASPPLSFAQARLWFLDQLEPGSAAYNMPLALDVRGAFAVPAMQAAMDEIVRRHEVLRTTFGTVAGEPRQRIAAPAAVFVPVVDLGALPAAARQQERQRLAHGEAARAFDLARGPLLRTAVLRLAADRHAILANMHHIVSDGWSLGVLVREFGALYAAFDARRPSPLPALPVQYADFAVWQRRRLAGDPFAADLAWWREQLAGLPPALELPADRPRPAVRTRRGAVHGFTLPRPTLDGLAALSRRQGTTLFMSLLAAFAAVLHRYTGRGDLAVGTPIAGRLRTEVEPLIGCFVNTLVLRLDLGGDPDGEALLRRVRQTTLAAYAHQEVPFERLAEALAPERDLTRTPFVQVMFVLQNAPEGPLRVPGLTLQAAALPTGMAMLDLTCTLVETAHGVEGTFEYSRDLFAPPTLARLGEHFGRLAAAVAAAPECRLSQLPLLTPAERHQLLVEWNGGAPGAAPEATLPALFALHSARAPLSPAVSLLGETLTYGELERRANRVAWRLRRLGVGPEERVGLLLPRSLAMVVGLLGILKAGGAYVPLDPLAPAERLAWLCRDSGVRVLLADERSVPPPELAPALTVVRLESGGLLAAPAAAPGDEAAPPLLAGPDNLCYVIYTSGSTGQPKGVLVRHGSVARLLSATAPWFGFGPADVWTLFHSHGFDFSVWELWGALAFGGRLVVVPYWVSRSPQELLRLLAAERVTVLNQTPSALRQLIAAEADAAPGADRDAGAGGDPPHVAGDAGGVAAARGLPALRLVILGGEALDLAALAPWSARLAAGAPRVVNMYGITETTVHVTYRPLAAADLAAPHGSPLGAAIPDLSLRLLGPRLEVVPVGVPGEICVGGAGVARGYLGRPELTAERFVPDPIAIRPGERLYRSGDLARYRPDGDLDYLGRGDHQVKVRGFRIEPGEIEAALLAHPAVRAAVVLPRQGASAAGAADGLTAYLVTEPDAVQPAALRQRLAARLPDYMVPAEFVFLPSLPLTAHGKLDRRALAAAERPAAAAAAGEEPPRTPGEELVAGIFAEVLGVSGVGATADFFALGGHSMLATRVAARVQQVFGVELPVRAVFETPTVAGLARRLGEAAADAPAAPPLLPVPRGGELPLSFAQQRLWFIHQLAPASAAYNIAAAVRLTGELSPALLTCAFAAVVGRHEVLRTTFAARGGEPLQVVAAELVPHLPVVDLTALPAAAAPSAAAALAAAAAHRPFDLAAGPLFRLALLRLAPHEHRLLLTLHHIAADGWSLGVLVRELGAHYSAGLAAPAEPLPPPAAVLSVGDAVGMPLPASPALPSAAGSALPSVAGAPLPNVEGAALPSAGGTVLTSAAVAALPSVAVAPLPNVEGAALPSAGGTVLTSAAVAALPSAAGAPLPSAGGTVLPSAAGTPLPSVAGAALPPLPVQYADFAVWQRGWLAGAVLDEQLAWWRRQLAGVPRLLALPADRPRPALPSQRGGRVPFVVPPALAAALAAASRREGATRFMTLLAGFGALLGRLADQEDLLVGTPVASRNRPEIEGLIGFFVNTLVVRVDGRGEPSFGDLLARVRREALGAFAHQDVPFERLVEELAVDRDLSYSPLFQVMLALQGAPAAGFDVPGLRLETLPPPAGVAMFDLTLSLEESAAGFGGFLEYSADLFDGASIRRLGGQLDALLAAAVAAPRAALSALPLLSAAERWQLVGEWNDTAAAYREGAWCVHELIAAQARRTPDAVAVVAEEVGAATDAAAGVSAPAVVAAGMSPPAVVAEGASAATAPLLAGASASPACLTYAALEARAELLARHLRGLGVGPETVVAIAAERSLSLLVGLLAILKAGGAYLPLDLDHPAERLRYMLADAAAAVLLTERRHAAHLGQAAAPATLYLDDPRLPAAVPPVAESAGAAPENLAYVIYTSGSTGLPKGTMNSHRGIVNRLLWMEQHYRLGSADRVLQKTPTSFDVSVWELFAPLVAGATVVMARPGGHRDSDYLSRTVAEQEITILHFVPSMLRVWLDAIAPPPPTTTPATTALAAASRPPGAAGRRSLRLVLASGEALPYDVQQRHAALVAAPLHNLYGPTEAAVEVTWWATDAADGRGRVPIGRPLANTRIHLLDRLGGPVPLGAPGELAIGGVQVGRGYLGRPALTAERFVPDGLAGEAAAAGGRLYRTGDLARYLADGAIEYLGRVDFQVKLRGMRVEPGEIEAALLAHPALLAAAVLALPEPAGGARLVAYVVPSAPAGAGEAAAGRSAAAAPADAGRSAAAAAPAAGGAAPAGLPSVSNEELAAFLRGRLPAHMVPASFVALPALPLTAHGKVDRKALAAAHPADRPAAAAHPATQFTAPQGPIEEVLAEIVADVLGAERPERRPRVGAHDDFFALGGHSLLATRVISRLREALGVEIPLRTLFEAPTVARLAQRVRAARQGGHEPPIAARPRHGEPPLSFAQQRLWFLDRLAPDNPFYNVFAAVHLAGALDLDALRRALVAVERRHEALRTTFRQAGDRPVQVIAPRPECRLALVDLGDLSAVARRDSELARLAEGESQRPFDLARGPLWRAHLLRLGARDHTLLLNLHHVISDGWSMGVLFREIALLYDAFSQGLPPTLPELPIQYADFAVWQREWLSGARLAAELGYWRRQLAGLPEALELPRDRPRPAVESFRGATHSFVVPAPLVGELTALTRRHGATLSMTMLTGFAALLGRYSGAEDLAVGMAIANRTRREIEGLIGFFVNTLVVRTDLAGSPVFAALLGRVREASLGAYAHQDLPFERLVEELHPERDLGRNPLIQVMFGYQNFPPVATTASGLVLSAAAAGSGAARSAKFDLTLFLTEDGDRLAATVEYNSEIFAAATVKRLAAHLVALLAAAVAQPATAVARLPLLDPAQRQQLAREWNDSGAAYPAAASLQALFEARVRRAPGAPALLFDAAAEGGEAALDYGELNRRANRLAHRLRRLGVGPESRVGLCCGRSPELVVGLLGIVKAGGAYVPLDPDYPAARLAFMIEDCGLRVLVGDEPALARLPAALLAGAERVLVGRPLPGGAAAAVDAVDGEGARRGERTREADDDDPPVATDGGSLAYVIYTSGSTGRPKGVAVVHRAVARLVLGTGYAAFGADEVYLQLAPISFDASTFEIWACLLHGARLAIPPAHALSLAEIGDAVARHRVTTLWLTTALFHRFVEDHLAALRPLRQILTGGEVLSPPHVRRAVAELPDTRLVVCYGPTENTTFTSCDPLRDAAQVGSSVALGRPIANTWMYVLDAEGQLAPPGVVGELCTGGDGLARGYLARPELTAERFVPDPVAGGPGGGAMAGPGSRLYRTGDWARTLPDGRYEFMGRVDQQVKVRGFRVEPGEIEARLDEHPAVLHSVVVAHAAAAEERGGGPGEAAEAGEGAPAGEAPTDRTLVAYVVQDPAYEAAAETPAAVPGEQVSQWSEIFDDIYREQAVESDPTFNIVGWNSSYTELPLPRGEMEEWLADTTDRIAGLAPRRVLELGCGTGMILFRIAPRCDLYTATDVSARALAYVEGLLERPAAGGGPRLDRSRVQLLQRAADQLDGMAADSFDTVILNSVVQYFPSAAYLATVVERAAAVVRPGGAIFLGDLRSLPLLGAFQTSLELFAADAATPLPRLRQKLWAREQQENELAVDPAFFAALRARVPKLARVEVHPKRGRAHNELTGFRYQVVLRVGAAAPASGGAAETAWLDWQEEGLSLDALRRYLVASRPRTLGLRNVPNARVAEAVAAARLLADAESAAADLATAGDLRRLAAGSDAAGGAVDPQDLWELPRTLPELAYEVELGCASSSGDGCFEAVLRRRPAAGELTADNLAAGEPAVCEPAAGEAAAAGLAAGDGEPPLAALLPQPWAAPAAALEVYANHPLRGRFARRLAPELRAFLKERLPEYLVPTTFVLLDALPLSPSGKVDRRRLPAPDPPRQHGGRAFVAPRNPTEAKLAEIWRELLGIERIGVADDFFELGGHSLLATQAVSRVRAAFGVELPLRTFFEAPSVAAVAAEVASWHTRQAADELPPIVPVPRDGQLPLSFAQERLWFLRRLETRALAYNESAAFRMDGALDAAALRFSLDEVVRRHESLRTAFPEVNGQPVQRILPPRRGTLPVVDLGALAAAAGEAELLRLKLEQAERPFDLGRGPLLHGLLVRLAERVHAALFAFHHIVFDGWSMGVFARELSALYAARIAGAPSPLPPLAVQYADFAAWQRRWLQGPVLDRQLAYWRERLAGVAVLELPSDRPRPAVSQAPSRQRQVAIPPALTPALRGFSRLRGVTLFMTLLAGFQAVLHRYTGQDDIAVGSPIANRSRGEVEPLIGFFVNMLVMRGDLGGDPSFDELLPRVRQAALGAYAHQDMPFEKLVLELRPDRSLRHTPLFQVSFQLLNMSDARLVLPGLALQALPFAVRSAKFDFDLALIEEPERLAGLLDYDADLFDPTTMERLLAHLATLLAGAVADPASRVSRLPLLTGAERWQLVAEWNAAQAAPSAGWRLHAWLAAESQDARAAGSAGGQPQAGAAIFVLDSRWQPVPIGVAGELCLAEVGAPGGAAELAADLAAARFIPNPFAGAANAGSRLVRSGRAVRLLAGGEIASLPRPERPAELDGAAAAGAGEFEAPRTATEAALAEIWREMLGAERVGVRDSFFGLGGHSMLAVLLMVRIEGRFGKSLPLTTLFTAPTLEKLAARIAQADARAARSIVVALQPAGSDVPFFCVHPAGGNVLCYLDLARHLPPEVPFYGLRAADSGGGADPGQIAAPGGPGGPGNAAGAAGGRLPTVEGMAAHYLRQMREVQPHPPYRLGGWSLGGLIAFEMARQLDAAGCRPELLALIDTPPPAAPGLPPPTDDELLLWFAEELIGGQLAPGTAARPAGAAVADGEALADSAVSADGAAPADTAAPANGAALPDLAALRRQLQARPDGEPPLDHLARLGHASGLLPADLGPAEMRPLFATFSANLLAGHAYAPAPYAGGALLCLAAATAAARGDEMAAGWRRLVAGELAVQTLPGDHRSLVREPQVERLGGVIGERLGDAPLARGGRLS